ncbi:MAG: AAA family ATPase [Candidatus Woesearchaeota archaeon]
MIIKSLKLENIRSYVNETIDFPSGTILLSGDIGSGKSTILLATEFALFGLNRSDLGPASLLRNGKNQGSVELKIGVEGKEFLIKRILKRGKNDIKQIAGYIIKDGIKKDATASELRSDILNLLGYPKELLTKSKDLIYRYTVYTPQEAMKQIITGGKEERLETLRKVFGIDKYKKIRENALIAIKDIRDKSRIYQDRIKDLDEKIHNKKLKKNEIKEIEVRIKVYEKEVEETRERLNEKRKEIESIEEGIQKYNMLKNQNDVMTNNLMNKVQENNNLKEEIEEMSRAIINIEKEIKIPGTEQSLDIIHKQINELSQMLTSQEKDIQSVRTQISIRTTKINTSREVIERVSKIDKCPLCEQNVEHEHKYNIKKREGDKIIEIGLEIKSLSSDEQKRNQMLEDLKEKIERYRRIEKDISIRKVREENLIESIKRIRDKNSRLQMIKKEIGEINIKRMELNDRINKIKDIEDRYKIMKIDLEKENKTLREKEIKKAENAKEKEGILKMIEIIEKEIEEKNKDKAKLSQLNQMQHWLEGYFIKLMEVIEKNVMVSLHQEFNSLFQTWFNTLIEDEIINVRLDDQFTPIIEQNGYETEINNLSGGEKTSLALSYRLSLNKIINSMISTIKTKDLIILDEPTDGFSTDQLDKVREVIDELKNKQIIIVSHESKIESFVENIIRIGKEEHISRIVS